MKTICIAGKNDIAVDVMMFCKKHFSDCSIVCVNNRNDSGVNSWQKSAKWFAKKNGIKIINLQDVYEIENMLFLSTEFDRIIRPDKFKSKELYNIHFSLLPKYKGCFTAIMPILNGESHTGVTLHRMRTGIDTGEIIEQIAIRIDESDTSLDVYKKCIKYGTELIIKNLDNLLKGDVTAYPQESKGSTYYSKATIDYSNLVLDINSTAYQVQNQIRAFCFRPYQLLSWNKERYVECVITDEISDRQAGTVIDENESFVKIATIDYNAILFKDTFQDVLTAIKIGDNERAKKLCKSTKIIESQDEHGWSPLTVAVYNNNTEMVSWLLDQGAKVDILNNNGTNLLMYAKNCFINTGDSTIFELLLELGLSPKQQDYYGKSLNDYCREEGIVNIGKWVVA